MAFTTEVHRIITRFVADVNRYKVEVNSIKSTTINVAQSINVQVNKISNNFRELGNTVSNTATQSLRRFGSSLSLLGNQIQAFSIRVAALLAPLGYLAKLSFDDAVSFQTLKIGLLAVTGSVKEMNKQFEVALELAKLPGLGIEEAARSMMNLQAAGFGLDQTTNIIKQLGNAIALFSTNSREDLAGAMRQLVQLKGSAQVYYRDLAFIIDKSPAISAAIRNIFGTVDTQAIQALGVKPKQFIELLVKELEKLPRAGSGWANLMENFRDEVKKTRAVFGAEIAKVVVPIIENLKNALQSLRDWFVKLSPATRQTIAKFVVFGAILGPIILIVGTLSAAFLSFVAAVSIAGAVVLYFAGPIGVAVAAVLSLVAAIAGLGTVWGIFSSLTKAGKEAKDVLVEMEKEMKRLKDSADETPKFDAEAMKEAAKWASIGDRITKEFMTPIEKAKEKLKEVEEALLKGAISFTTYERAVKSLRGEIDGTTKAMEELVRAASSLEDKFKSPVEKIRDEIRLINKAFAASLISEETWGRAASDIAKRFAELTIPKIEPISRSVGATEGRFSVSGFSAELGAKDTFSKMLESDKRREELLKRHAIALDSIKAELEAILVKPSTEVTVTKIE